MSITGVVRGLSTFDTNGVERQEIHVNKTQARGLPYVEGSRVEITLIVDGHQYAAGLRCTEDNKYVWICPDLQDVTGESVKLVQVLAAAGFGKNQRLELECCGDVVTVRPVAS